MDINQEIFLQLPSEIEMGTVLQKYLFQKFLQIIEKYKHII